MHIIRHRLEERGRGLIQVELHADRLTLQKSRWRGVAEDGTEFGFDLSEPLRHGDEFFATGEAVYVINQRPEPVLEVSSGLSPKQAALLAWSVGNLHQPLEIERGCMRMADEPVLRSLLAGLNVSFLIAESVFQPHSGPVKAHHHEHVHHD
jgi:urease accessory protein